MPRPPRRAKEGQKVFLKQIKNKNDLGSIISKYRDKHKILAADFENYVHRFFTQINTDLKIRADQRWKIRVGNSIK